MSSNILLSVHPKYADKIFERTKTVELLRVRPKLLEEGDLVLLYVSSPVQALVGAFKVDKIIFLFPRAGVGTHSRRASVEVKRELSFLLSFSSFSSFSDDELDAGAS